MWGDSHAEFSRSQTETGISRKQARRVRDFEQDRGHAGLEDHRQGQTDGTQAREGREAGPGQIGELWRGRFGGVTYRVRSLAPYSFYPGRLVLERLISRPGEEEGWALEWGMA